MLELFDDVALDASCGSERGQHLTASNEALGTVLDEQAVSAFARELPAYFARRLEQNNLVARACSPQGDGEASDASADDCDALHGSSWPSTFGRRRAKHGAGHGEVNQILREAGTLETACQSANVSWGSRVARAD